MVGSELFPIELRDGKLTVESTHIWVFDSSNLIISKFALHGALKVDGCIRLIADSTTVAKYECFATPNGALEDAKGRLPAIREWAKARLAKVDQLDADVEHLRRECSNALVGTMSVPDPKPDAVTVEGGAP